MLNSKDLSLFKYFNKILLKNKIILAMIIINVISVLFIQFLPLFGSQSYYQAYKTKALLFIGLPCLLILMFVGISSIILFVKTKKNNVDLYLYTKDFKNSKIVIYKQLSILFFSLHILALIFISLFIRIILGLGLYTSLILFLSQIASFFILIFIWLSIFTFLATYFRFFTSLLLIPLLSISVVSISIIPIFAAQYSKIKPTFDLDQNQNNIVKIYQINNNLVSSPIYAIYNSPLAVNNNEIQGQLKNSFIKNSPFNFILGLNSMLAPLSLNRKMTFNQKIAQNTKYAFSYLDISYNKIKWNPTNDTEYILAGLNEKTIFDYKTKSSLFTELDNELQGIKIIADKINNKDFWKLLNNELEQRIDWTDTLSENQKNILINILGINSTKSILFSLFNNFDILKNKTIFLRDYFTKKYNQEFADFLLYAWSDHNVKSNVFSYQSLIDYSKIARYHPDLKSYDELEKANIYDLQFIKNKLLNIVEDKGAITSFQVLDNKKVYVNVKEWRDLFPQKLKFQTKADVYQYIDNHSTINNLNDLIKRINGSIPEEVYKMQFKNNVQNNLIINNGVKISEMNSYRFTWAYLSALIIIAILLQFLIKRKVEKGDLIW